MRILGLDGQRGEGTDGRTDGRLEITPCVLQDIGPLGSLPKKLEIQLGTFSAAPVMAEYHRIGVAVNPHDSIQLPH